MRGRSVRASQPRKHSSTVMMAGAHIPSNQHIAHTNIHTHATNNPPTHRRREQGVLYHAQETVATAPANAQHKHTTPAQALLLTSLRPRGGGQCRRSGPRGRRSDKSCKHPDRKGALWVVHGWRHDECEQGEAAMSKGAGKRGVELLLCGSGMGSRGSPTCNKPTDSMPAQFAQAGVEVSQLSV
jgi:hypothetical protein